MVLKIAKVVSALLVALLCGLAFAHVLEQSAKLQYDAAFYIALQKTLYVQWAPPNVGGALEPLAIAATALVAFFGRSDKRTLWLTLGALFALLLAFPLVFFLFVAPANAVFSAATPMAVPANWTEMRTGWETGHAPLGLSSNSWHSWLYWFHSHLVKILP